MVCVATNYDHIDLPCVLIKATFYSFNTHSKLKYENQTHCIDDIDIDNLTTQKRTNNS